MTWRVWACFDSEHIEISFLAHDSRSSHPETCASIITKGSAVTLETPVCFHLANGALSSIGAWGKTSPDGKESSWFRCRGSAVPHGQNGLRLVSRSRPRLILSASASRSSWQHGSSRFQGTKLDGLSNSRTEYLCLSIVKASCETAKGSLADMEQESSRS